MDYVALFTGNDSRWYPQLVTALSVHQVPLQVINAPVGGRVAEAIAGLAPLGFSGALVEEPRLQREAAEKLNRLELEAAEAGVVDALRVQFGEVQGHLLLPAAVRLAMEQTGFNGARVLWLGPAQPGMREALRLASKVHVMRPTPLEAEDLLNTLPPPQRGNAVFDKTQAQALAGEVDLVMYNGGPLPLALLQPYHGLFAFEEPQQDAYMVVDQVISPAYFRQLYLSRLLGWVSGVDLPPEDFVE